MKIMHIHAGRKVLSNVPGTPRGEAWVYQIGFPLQLSASEAGLLCNIRRGGVKAYDVEVGSDLIPFDAIARIEAERAIPLVRGTSMRHPETGEEQMLSVYPVTGGFVPLGATLPGGRDHPHAGTGFGVCQMMGYPPDLSRAPGKTDQPIKLMVVQQYSYDGTRFTVSSQEWISEDQLFPRWRLSPSIMANAIPDGEDLIGGMCGVPSGETARRSVGIVRWKVEKDHWRVAAYTPIAQQTVSSGRMTGEPSVVRGMDGALLFSARGVFTAEEDAESILVWRSTDGGATWRLALKKRSVRTATPVSISRTVDGSVYLAGNPHAPTDSRGVAPANSTNLRETMVLWPLSGDGSRLRNPVLLRDGPACFPPSTDGSLWRIDHPAGAVVRLSDGKWHGLLVYRVLTKGEVTDDAALTPYTGCYISEIVTENEAVPVWHF